MPTSLQPFFLLILFISVFSADGIQVVIVNNCKETVWPGILATAGHPTPNNGGFSLCSGGEAVLQIPDQWSGRIWGRQGCWSDPKTGKFCCQTGDCSGGLECMGTGGVPPATLVQMTFGTPQSPLHFYDVSLVDGFNLPVSMVAMGGGVGCGVAACEADLNVCCPSNLAVKNEGKVIACKSACLAAKCDRNCCTGEYANPKMCQATPFGHLFKEICPRAYSFPFDQATGLKTCRASQYVITFCPPK